MTEPVSLHPIQFEVANLFFGLPESKGFLLAGAAGLAAQGMTTRATEDLDLFTGPGQADVGLAAAAFETAAAERGWATVRVRDAGEFVRLEVAAGEMRTRMVLAVDAVPGRPGRLSVAGPTLDPLELAGRKMVALFDRALNRDFADVYVLARQFSRQRLLELAVEADRGFDRRTFAEVLQSLRRYSDDEIPLPPDDVPALRVFFATWSGELLDTASPAEP